MLCMCLQLEEKKRKEEPTRQILLPKFTFFKFVCLFELCILKLMKKEKKGNRKDMVLIKCFCWWTLWFSSLLADDVQRHDLLSSHRWSQLSFIRYVPVSIAAYLLCVGLGSVKQSLISFNKEKVHKYVCGSNEGGAWLFFP